jgi:hypothetical protein
MLKEYKKGIQIISEGILYENPKPYLYSRQAMHPSLVNLGNGELICSYSLGEAVESIDARNYLSRSTDNADTWVFEKELIGRVYCGRAISSTVRISKISDGLVGFGAIFYRDNPEEGLINHETLGLVPMNLVTIASKDGGRHWTKPEIIRSPFVGPAFEVCHSLMELADGRWIVPTSTWAAWNGELPNGHKGVILISSDKGLTWNYSVTFDGDKTGVIPWEQSAIVLDNGDILIVAWYHNPSSGKNLPNHFTISRDGGKTFSEPQTFGIDGQTCKMLKLEDGRILLAYRRNDKPGLWLSLSEFDGEKWTHLSEYPVCGFFSGMSGQSRSSDELSGLAFGYPQMIQLSDGNVFMAYWCLEGWSSKIKCVKFSIE